MQHVIFVFLSAAVYTIFLAQSIVGQEFSPKSPEVLLAVQKASEFLQREGAGESRLGGRALVCLALYKAGVDVDHPLMLQTIKDIQATIDQNGNVSIAHPIYSAGIIILFLSELDPDQYRRELGAYSAFLLKHQRKDGAWTYLDAGTADAHASGDMSMTQYGVMALWTLHQLGMDVPGERVNRVARWLVNVQDAEGGYAYQSTVADDFRTVSLDSVRISMTSAGMASVYVCRDLFGYNTDSVSSDKIHEAFMEKPADGPSTRSIDNYRFSIPESAFNTVQKRGNIWLEKNFFPINPGDSYYYYYLYAFERYAAFRELAEHNFRASPPWYNKTVEVLLKNQQDNGQWNGSISSQVDTAYAVLFLLRSTMRSFAKVAERMGGGNLLGGRGLPRLTDRIKVEQGQVVSLSEISSTEQLMERLGHLDQVDEDTLALLSELPADEVESLLNRNKAKIKSLVGDENPDKRFAAVTLLGKSGDVSYVTALVYALSDPDPGVAQAALSALNRLARESKDAVLPSGADADSVRERERIIARWKAWYRRIAPDAVFENR